MGGGGMGGGGDGEGENKRGVRKEAECITSGQGAEEERTGKYELGERRLQ